MRIRQLFNNGWSFTKMPIGTTLKDVTVEGTEWSAIDLPHDWLIYNAKNLYETCEGWYRKNFMVTSLEEQVVSIRFEGIYMDSTVYVNGEVVGEWKYGYSTFEFDITKLLNVGNNEIIVRVVHQSPNSRWYSGAGIYRNVWLTTTSTTHIVSDGIYIACKKGEASWQVEVDTEIIAQDKAVVKHTILSREGDVITTSMQEVAPSDFMVNDSQALTVVNPMLWGINHPYLYTLKTEILVNDTLIDEIRQTFGFRTLRFDNNEGFFLNDEYVKLHGSCEHHDLGCLGGAMNKTAQRRKFELLKEMGVNSIRSSHNMPAVEFMELADEMGFLIVTEAFDMWERGKTNYDYARFFPEWYEKDVASWVRRDRNRPSIIMWSIGNEIYDTHAGPRGVELTKILKACVHKHDPKHNAPITIGSNFMPWEGAQNCGHEIDVVGYNYAEYLYHNHHEKYPNWVIYGSETASTVQSRGIYHFPASQSMLSNDDEQCSSLGNCTTSWGAKSTSKCITDDRDAKFCLGQYIWTGWDYIGEPTPYHTKNSYLGQIDTAGFQKDTFYIFQAEWTDYKINPMVHILPYWDFNEGQLIDIRIYSNAPKTELFLNDKSLGVYEIDHQHGLQLSGQWQIPYEKGTIKAVAYDENDKIIAVDEQSSFGDAAALVLEPDKTELKADGEDLIFVTISTIDAEGHHVANANNRVEVEVTGAGRLVGLDNGNSTDYDQYKGTSRKLFSGKLLAVIASRFDAGEINVSVSSPGMETQNLKLVAVDAPHIEGISDTFIENTKSEHNEEIPIRKIELTNRGVKKFTPDDKITSVSAQILPTNASYTDIKWSLITNTGAKTNLADLEVNGMEATIKAKGDGIFRLRCAASNGTPRMEIISELEFEVTGLGQAFLNPYELVSGSLYSTGKGDLTNGNDRGIATQRDGVSHVGFKDIDFGEFGSDELILPVFYNNSEPLGIQVWEGMPEEEGSELIDTVLYQAPARWNTYQERTFKLPRRVKGITTICFVLDTKIHLKGFYFNKLEKAYEKLLATENNHLAGDSFTVTDTAVENIGNNVSLEFMNMDFGGMGVSKIVICGRSHIEFNTIHIRFHSEAGDVNQIVEFPYSEEYIEQEFELESVEGMQTVKFVFMPGSNFDFRWFRFEG